MNKTNIDQSFDIQVLGFLASCIPPLELKSAKCQYLIDGLNKAASGRFKVVRIDHRRSGYYSLCVRVLDPAIAPLLASVKNIEII